MRHPQMEVRRRAAQNVKRLRREKAISQEELAERSGLHRTYISGIERAVRNPTLTVMDKLAAGLGVALASLVGED
jgi:transcriptional regulator with XRE-family HTH domain